jgi:2-hydroxy-6-oxonona-2,4-dienedioate hydrolase/4,5:9,10-diseco-3-hydroxy-5,9,17-trioxoandrosta-1(10),2-diene-4-oate hydrolase
VSTAQTEEPKLVEHTVQTTLGTVAVSEAGEGPVLVMLRASRSASVGR